MVLKPQLWIVAVQYEDEQAGNYGRWSVHYGTAEEMSRVFERLLHEPMVHTAYKARVHETVSPQTKRVLKP